MLGQAIPAPAAAGKAGKKRPRVRTVVLSEAHNGKNPAEAERIRAAHPGESECVLRNRVLGAIAVTRGTPLPALPALSSCAEI